MLSCDSVSEKSIMDFEVSMLYTVLQALVSVNVSCEGTAQQPCLLPRLVLMYISKALPLLLDGA